MVLAVNKKIKGNGKTAQASIEYVLLLSLIAMIAYQGIKQIREVFFGWDREDGAIVTMLNKNIKEKLSTSEDGF